MPTIRTPSRPIVGITLEAEELPSRVRLSASWNYADCVVRAGGMPIMLPPVVEQVQDQAALCDAFVLTGGDDPSTELFGQPTHPKATRVLALRQRYETALLEHLAERHPDKPVLGVCLGMQMMALIAGGRLNQHLPDTHQHADLHWDNSHAITWCPEAVSIAGLADSIAGLAAANIECLDGGNVFLAEGNGAGRNGDGGNGAGGSGAGENGVVENGAVGNGAVGNGVHSRHRQAVDDPGSLVVLARAADGVIEAIADPARAFYLGVQWHPERTEDASLGADLFCALVEALGLPTV